MKWYIEKTKQNNNNNNTTRDSCYKWKLVWKCGNGAQLKRTPRSIFNAPIHTNIRKLYYVYLKRLLPIHSYVVLCSYSVAPMRSWKLYFCSYNTQSESSSSSSSRTIYTIRNMIFVRVYVCAFILNHTTSLLAAATSAVGCLLCCILLPFSWTYNNNNNNGRKIERKNIIMCICFVYMADAKPG